MSVEVLADRLFKESLKARDNLVTYEFVHGIQCAQSKRGRGQFGYVKSYRNLYSYFALHIRWDLNVHSIAIVHTADVVQDLHAGFNDKLHRVDDRRYESMLVGVVEELKDCQQPSFGPLPSVIRLETFDSAVCCGNDSLDIVFASPVVSIKVSEYGELRSLVGSFRSKKGELIRDVIESRPEIMGNITNNNAPFWGRQSSPCQLNGIQWLLRIFLNVDFIGVTVIESTDTPPNSIDVLLCPSYLPSAAIELVHDRIEAQEGRDSNE